jgi:pyruvate/2-oxoglutarate dehydrogenase complex dihydrolipoamide acyltransferase (E2) component
MGSPQVNQPFKALVDADARIIGYRKKLEAKKAQLVQWVAELRKLEADQAKTDREFAARRSAIIRKMTAYPNTAASLGLSLALRAEAIKRKEAKRIAAQQRMEYTKKLTSMGYAGVATIIREQK